MGIRVGTSVGRSVGDEGTSDGTQVGEVGLKVGSDSYHMENSEYSKYQIKSERLYITIVDKQTNEQTYLVSADR